MIKSQASIYNATLCHRIKGVYKLLFLRFYLWYDYLYDQPIRWINDHCKYKMNGIFNSQARIYMFHQNAKNKIDSKI